LATKKEKNRYSDCLWKSKNVQYNDTEIKTGIALHDFSGELITGKVHKIKTTVGKMTVKREGWPEISAGISTILQLKDGTLQINKLQADSFDSQLTGSGEYAEDRLSLKTSIKLLVKTVRGIFRLGSPGEGELDAKNISFADKNTVDLKLSGEFIFRRLWNYSKVEDKIRVC
jgi:hypothetical protein